MRKLIDIQKPEIKALTNDALDCDFKLKPYIEMALVVMTTNKKIRKDIKDNIKKFKA